MNKSLIFIVAAIIVLSCKQNLTHREKINLDSIGIKKVLKVSPPDSTYGYKIDTGDVYYGVLLLKSGTITWQTEIEMQTDSFKTYRQNGVWHVENPAASLEMMYNYFNTNDSLNRRPFILITPDDTFHFYHGDTIHVGPDPAIKQL